MGFDLRSGFGADIFDDSLRPVIFRSGSYIIGNVFVTPQNKSAVNVKTGEEAGFDGYGDTTSLAAETLAASDMILEHDLMPRMHEKKEAAK